MRPPSCGQNSDEYAGAISTAATIWERIASALPAHAVLLGTADHGHIDYREDDKAFIPHRSGPEFYGDPRAVLVRRADRELDETVAGLPCRAVATSEYRSWLGSGGDHPDLAGRLPERILLADPGRLLIPRFMDKRLIGYHGGLEAEEVRIPLLVSGG